eukprot:TRINITY_DN1413_c0_g1_i3.p1 TRINITY_DN1413_c0_g1~~TRINITY_DN1413_c0_g1_i3.p1  ORF type:complete len:169 (+),score=41.94 TRINITY_DN1413_c0_g1_i3:397-903(+)
MSDSESEMALAVALSLSLAKTAKHDAKSAKNGQNDTNSEKECPKCTLIAEKNAKKCAACDFFFEIPQKPKNDPKTSKNGSKTAKNAPKTGENTENGAQFCHFCGKKPKKTAFSRPIFANSRLFCSKKCLFCAGCGKNLGETFTLACVFSRFFCGFLCFLWFFFGFFFG